MKHFLTLAHLYQDKYDFLGESMQKECNMLHNVKKVSINYNHQKESGCIITCIMNVCAKCMHIMHVDQATLGSIKGFSSNFITSEG